MGKISNYQRQNIKTCYCSCAQQQLYFCLLLIIVIACNYYDMVHTMQLCAAAQAIEGNPLMRHLLNTNPIAAVMFKLTATWLFALVMMVYSKIHFKRALAATTTIAVLYGLLTAWHLSGQYITAWFISFYSGGY